MQAFFLRHSAVPGLSSSDLLSMKVLILVAGARESAWVLRAFVQRQPASSPVQAAVVPEYKLCPQRHRKFPARPVTSRVSEASAQRCTLLPSSCCRGWRQEAQSQVDRIPGYEGVDLTTVVKDAGRLYEARLEKVGLAKRQPREPRVAKPYGKRGCFATK